MSTYSRLPKGVADFPVGIAAVNQAIDNNTALYEAWKALHGIIPPGITSANPLTYFGRHNDVNIARSTASFTIDTSAASPALASSFMGPVFIRGSVRAGVGSWTLYLTGCQLYGVLTSPIYNGSMVPTKVTASVSGTALSITTQVLSGTAFVMADVPFSVTVHGLLI